MNTIVPKFQSLYFKARMHIHDFLRLPAQTTKEIGIYKFVLNNIDQIEGNKKLSIFEWGSGFSTVYYANFLRHKKMRFEWHSVDNDRAWHEKVKSLIKKKHLESYVRIYLYEFDPFWKKPEWRSNLLTCSILGPESESEISYINFPRQLHCKFDIAIIDGRFRRRCMQTAKEVLLPEGIAILHDAQKKHYHIGLNNFKYGSFYHGARWYPLQEIPNKIWVGSEKNKDIYTKLNRRYKATE